MSCWAVVALKSSAEAKGRLSDVLTVEQRVRLARLMFDNVISALHHARSIDNIAVITPETPEALTLEPGITLLKDPGGDLNDAFSHAAQLLTQRGVKELLVLPADLPLLSGVEIDELIRRGRQSGLAIAPDKQGLGTNAVFVTLPTAFRFHFGIRSFFKHQAEAAAHGIDAQLVALPGLAFDIDEPQDLDMLLAQGGERYTFLRKTLNQT